MRAEEYKEMELVTPATMRTTVIYDSQTRLWFQKLLTSPKALARLKSASPGSGRMLLDYRMLSWISGAFLLLALADIMIGGLLLAERDYNLLATGLGAAVIYWICDRRMNQLLADLAARLAELDLPELPKGVTIYQMGEIYSRRYEVPSLVDAIWVWDQWLRNSFIGIYFATLGVFFLPFWQMIAWTAIGCMAIVGVIRLIVMSGKKY